MAGRRYIRPQYLPVLSRPAEDQRQVGSAPAGNISGKPALRKVGGEALRPIG